MISKSLENILSSIPSQVQLVAVSKFHPVPAIREAYDAGQRVFGESRPQELSAKVNELPSDIKWHFIGHLQTNKLKLVLPYVYMVESIDSLHLLEAVNKWGVNEGKTIKVLLELHIASEETKQGFNEDEILSILHNVDSYPAVELCGLMGMATNTSDESVIRQDFARISQFMSKIRSNHDAPDSFRELSIGMSGDYLIALEYGATIVRVGTAIFGAREY